MTTNIRPELSESNKYWVGKHRYYELKHFCLQYPIWKNIYEELCDSTIPLSMIERVPTSNLPGDPTSKRALFKAQYSEKIQMIERAAKTADRYLHNYIIKAVTEGLSYTYLKSKLDIPCSRDTYYDRYRKFFWTLNEIRD
jgi:hypothetical protein